MDSDYERPVPRRRWPWMVAAMLVCFAAGAAAALYLVLREPRVAALLHLEPIETAQAEAAAARRAAIVAMPKPAPVPAAAPDAAVAAQIAALAAKVAEIEGQTRAATGDASRAEGLLVAFAARRALDRGVQLGYVEGLLRDHFGHGQPEAVATILSAARTPVTLADLRNGLDAAAPALSAQGGVVAQSWWEGVRQQLATLVVVRRADQPSPLPADRVARAERMLEAGQVDGALAEVLRLPNHGAANGWIGAARRYLAGRTALDRVETAALLEPDPTPPVVPIPPAAISAAPAPVPAAPVR